MQPVTRRQLGLAAALLVIAVVAVLDITTGSAVAYIAVLTLGPFIAAATTTSRDTAAIGLVALAAAVGLGAADDIFGEASHVVRVAAVAVSGGIATWVAREREERLEALKRMSKIAETAQQAILHPVRPWVGTVAFAARYISAAEEAHIGGDLYEVVETRWGVRALIGDVKGKGLDAVRLASIVLTAFRETAFVQDDCGQVARGVADLVLPHLEPEDFVTALMIEFRNDELTIVNCGHVPPVLLPGGEDGRPRTLASDIAPPLGLLADAVSTRVPWRSGDRLFCYTDGLTEARNVRGEWFPLDTAVDACRPAVSSLDECLDAVIGRLEEHLSGSIRRDDIALLVAEQLGEPERLLPVAETTSVSPDSGT